MTEDTVECFNCGRVNPAWAHVCRHCGVPLRPESPVVRPTGFVPTDQRSLVSLAAAVASILAAIFIGFMLSRLNPTSPTVGLASPTPSASASPSPEASEPVATETAVPTPTATPGPPGTVVFGTGINSDGAITGPTETFMPGMTFAHTVTLPEPFGVPRLGEQVLKVAEDGAEQEVVGAADNGLDVDPAATQGGVVCCDAGLLMDELGTGNFILRVYRDTTLIAEGRFTLAPG